MTRHPTFRYLNWRTRAKCNGTDNPEQFFPDIRGGAKFRPTVLPVALRECHPCPVRRECLTYALESDPPTEHGLWGGVWFRKTSQGVQERHPLTPGAVRDMGRLGQRRAG